MPFSVEAVSPIYAAMRFAMAVSAEQLKIVPRAADGRIQDVLRRQMDLVMDDLAGLDQAALQAALA